MQDDWILSSRVAPFGDLRVKGYLLLTAAYRSLSRPSSAPDAKAFPLRSFQLDLLEQSLQLVLLVELCRLHFEISLAYCIVTLALARVFHNLIKLLCDLSITNLSVALL